MPDREFVDWHPYLEELSLALSRADDPRLIRDFLQSLLTPNEVQEVSFRWALVTLIDEGMSQRNIAKKLGLSLCKITRGSKELQKEASPFAAMIDIYREKGASPA